MCNARCPFCPRSLNGYPHNHGYQETNLSLIDIKKTFRPEFIAGLDEVLINGNFGDFVMNPESLEIIEYLRQHNDRMFLSVSTNGSARDRDFWRGLGQLNISVFFCIDGLEDTNHLYRQDTNYDLIIKNAKTFIEAGGRAVWKMTKFAHNAHQVDEVRHRAEELGFDLVQINETIRDTGPVYNRQGQKIHYIKADNERWPEQLTGEWIKEHTDFEIEMYSKQLDSTQVNIDCQAKKDGSIYLAADGHVYPCCWTGFSPQTFQPPTPYTHWNKEISSYIRHNHAPTVGLESALEWFEDLAQSWQSDQQPKVCQRFCRVKEQVR